MGHVSKQRITKTKSKIGHADYVNQVQQLSKPPTSTKKTRGTAKKPKKKIEPSPVLKSPPFWTWKWNAAYTLTAFSIFVAVLTVGIHGLDLLIGWPYHSLSIAYNSVATVCGLVVTGMAMSVYKELGRLG